MTTLHADNDGILIALTKDDQAVAGAVASISFDVAVNTGLLEDVRYNSNAYRLYPGPLLEKDGTPVTVDTIPAPAGIRRAIQILTEQEALIAAATTIGQVRTILEQNRIILRRLLIRLGED